MYNLVKNAFVIFVKTVQYVGEITTGIWKVLSGQLNCLEMKYLTPENYFVFIEFLVLLCYFQRVDI